jgi:hypothetical protein
MLTALLTIYALGAGLMFCLIEYMEAVEGQKCPFYKGFLAVVGWPIVSVGLLLVYVAAQIANYFEADTHEPSDL